MKHEVFNWMRWCIRCGQIVPWSVRLVGDRPLTEQENDYGLTLEPLAELLLTGAQKERRK